MSRTANVIPAPLICWAVEVHESYVGTFVDSLWLTKELAEQELARLNTCYPSSCERSVEEWLIGETATTDEDSPHP